jgi:hypothetical protein
VLSPSRGAALPGSVQLAPLLSELPRLIPVSRRSSSAHHSLLLCGSLLVPGWMFWVTGAGDPDTWPLVLAEEVFQCRGIDFAR